MFMGSYRTSIVIGLALLVVLGLFCTPVAARTVFAGDTIYVGEEGLDLTGLDPAVVRLVHYGNGAAGSTENTIDVENPDNFDLAATDVGGVTGAYYAWDATGPIPGQPFVIVEVPYVVLDVVLNGTTTSVNGMSVTNDRLLTFELGNNLKGLYGGPPFASMAIETTLPNGTKTSTFGGVDLSSVPIRSPLLSIPGIDLAGAEPGTYTVQAIWTNGTGLAGTGPDSNTVRFEVLDTASANVTMNMSGSGNHALGDKIVLNGTCTNSTAVYLFLTGPNLENGERLDMGGPVTDGDPATFTEVLVEANDTWEYRWDTSSLKAVIDPGIYAIYAEPEPRDYANLAQHAVAGVVFAMPTVTAEAHPASIVPGDPLVISGTATGSPGNVYVWIFGPNFRVFGDATGVAPNGTFAYMLDPADTADLAPGRYDAVVQHPMTDGEQSVRFVPPSLISEPDTAPVNLEGLTSSAARDAFLDAFTSPAVDDAYAEVTFRINESLLAINPIGDRVVNTSFLIDGTTNPAADETLTVTVTNASGFPVTSGEAAVGKGALNNTWSFGIGASVLDAGEYTVTVESASTDVSRSATFLVVESTGQTLP
jgi:hypothetical protein